MVESRNVTLAQHRWGRLFGPARAWCRNRWNWRAKRRMRTAAALGRQLCVPTDGLGIDADDNTRRVAELFEHLPSTVLHLGYGMGESVIVAAEIAPERVRPLVDDLVEFRDDEILGIDLSERGRRAVQHRHALAKLVREVVELRPKLDA